MEILNSIQKILKKYTICDMCLGRLVGNLLTGYENDERGRAIRMFFAMLYDAGLIKIKKENLSNINLRKEKSKSKKEECEICLGIFSESYIKKIVEKIEKKLRKERIEFKTFELGSIFPKKILEIDEKLKKEFGEFYECIKKNFNRVIGKILEKRIGKNYEKNADLLIIINLRKNKVILKPKSIFIFGSYKKLRRGISQAKWILKNGSKKYKTSIQEIIEKVIVKKLKAEKIRLSIAGREDVDVRCLDWRPFVIEIIEPKKRSFDLKKIEAEINKSKLIKVKLERLSNKEEVRRLKALKIDKTYRAIVTFEKPIKKEKLKNLKILEKVEIKQRTPLRVLHRRSDKVRIRRVKRIAYKLLTKKRIKLIIRAESGLYIKELIHGDEGRTKPSVAELLENKPKKIILDVIKIHYNESLK